MSSPSLSFRFGSRLVLDSKQVFFESALSYASVNLKPLVKGHVLVMPKRVVGRFGDLGVEEVTDLWTSAQRIANALQRWSRADAFTFAMQDGEAAGQTVDHVHIHILPRHKHDFENNDDVYAALDQGSTGRKLVVEPDDRRMPRSDQEMKHEADQLRQLFIATTTSSSSSSL